MKPKSLERVQTHKKLLYAQDFKIQSQCFAVKMRWKSNQKAQYDQNMFFNETGNNAKTAMTGDDNMQHAKYYVFILLQFNTHYHFKSLIKSVVLTTANANVYVFH